MPNVSVNQNGFPMGGGQPQDQMPAFTQRLETSLNPKIGVPGQDSQPDQQAAFMLKNDPQGAVKLAQTIMQAVQQKMMQARQAAMGGMGGMPQAPMQPQHPQQPQMMSQMQQAIPPMGGQ